MSSRGLPVLSGESGLSRYLSEIRKFPLLSPEDEYMFAKRWKEHGDSESARRLVTSHLRLVAKIAMGYRGYGLPVSEIVSEGNVGLMQAVKRFDPDKGFRLATYAMWWIRASIQEYVLRSWSMVKMGTTAAQKKLFFNLRKAKNNIGAIEEGDLTPAHTATLADQLGVTETEVTEMNRRLSGGDASLNAPLRSESESEWQDWLADDTADQETRLAEREEMGERHELLVNAMKDLTERERDIIQARRLQDEPATLEELSQKYGVSRERVRQIEVRAFEKLQRGMQAAMTAAALPAPASTAFRIDSSVRNASCVVTIWTPLSPRRAAPEMSWRFSRSCPMRCSTVSIVTPFSPRSSAVFASLLTSNAASRSARMRTADATASCERATAGDLVARARPLSTKGSGD